MIRDEDDNMAQRAHIEVMRQLFKGHPYGLRPLGEESSVSRLTRADMADYFKKRCAANNLVISVSGDVNAEGLMKKLKSVFEDLRHEEAPPDIIMAERPAAASIRDIEMDRQEGIVMTGFVTIPAADPDRYAFDLLGSMLSGSSGRLFNSLRDKEALAYSLGCTQKRGPGGGYFLFYAATTRDRLARTRKALTDEIGRIRRNGADDGELALAKKELVSQHKLKLQTNESFSMESALDELYGLGCDNLYKYEEGIKKVTNGDIKRIARKYFDMTGCAEVTIVSRD
jgi:zinc protease